MARRAVDASDLALKASLNLPKTSLPMRHGAFARESRHTDRLGKDLYHRQLRARKNAHTFVLHDGPPYANGDLHIGHFLNKVLKDIANRSHLLNGERVLFVPGWDCHGLPIELKALQEARAAQQTAGKNKANGPNTALSPLEIRSLARDVAEKAIARQCADFVRWGIMGDWDLEPEHRTQHGNVYITMDAAYEAAQLRVFKTLVGRGLVSRALRPVYWSPSSTTALAEAELEYAEAHVSTAVYVGFPLLSTRGVADATVAATLNAFPGGVHAVAWTTTPWTLPANVGLSVHPELTYVVAKLPPQQEACTTTGQITHILVAQSRLPDVLAQIKLDPAASPAVVLASFTGAQLSGCVFGHPLGPHSLAEMASTYPQLLHAQSGQRGSVLLCGHHVTSDSGTGIVHTAPGHGHDDFAVVEQYNSSSVHPTSSLPVLCPVDNVGKFTDVVGPALAGRSVLSDGNTAVLDMLHASGCLLALHSYTHRYPYDWRTKKPVIIRATDQWFVSTSALEQQCLEQLQSVHMKPAVSRNRLAATIGSRDSWCISRQRAWGVPIPAFFRSDTGQALLTPDIIEHVAAVIAQQGSDSWWKLSVEELLPPAIVREARAGGYSYIKGKDTLDVWFDSGSSWSAAWASNLDASSSSMAPGMVGQQSDMVVEGSDQHRGWFQSSLITAIAATGKAPYKSIVSCGFVVAEDGRKMSKSLGNVVAPGDIIDGKGTAGSPSASSSPSARASTSSTVKGGKRTTAPGQGGHGVDVLRYWVASSDYTRDIVIGSGVIDRISETHKKVRNTLRFLLGAVHGYHPTTAQSVLLGGLYGQAASASPTPLAEAWQTPVCQALHSPSIPSLKLLDRGLLHKLARFQTDVRELYGNMELEDVVYAIAGFVARDLSPFYIELCKDRLYLQPHWEWQEVAGWKEGEEQRKELPDRFVLQAILWETLRVCTRALAPIAPHTAEDVYQHSGLFICPNRDTHVQGQALEAESSAGGADALDISFEPGSTVFDSMWSSLPRAWHDEGAGWSWDALSALKTAVSRSLEVARMAKDIGSPGEASVTLHVKQGGALAQLLRECERSGQLEDLLRTSCVHVHEGSGSESGGRARPQSMRQALVEGQQADEVGAHTRKISGSGPNSDSRFKYEGNHTVSIAAVPSYSDRQGHTGEGGGSQGLLSGAQWKQFTDKAAQRAPGGSNDEGVRVVVEAAPGHRCVRCRKYRLEATEGAHQALCHSCYAHMQSMQAKGTKERAPAVHMQ